MIRALLLCFQAGVPVPTYASNDPIPFETPIEGADCVLVKGWHKAPNKADINKDGVVDMTDFAIISENWLQSSIVDN